MPDNTNSGQIIAWKYTKEANGAGCKPVVRKGYVGSSPTASIILSAMCRKRNGRACVPCLEGEIKMKLVENLREEIKVLHEIIRNSEAQIVNHEETIKTAGKLIDAQRNLINAYRNLKGVI